MGSPPNGILATHDPATGAEVSITLDYDSEIKIVKIPFTTSGSGSPRQIELTVTIGTDEVYCLPASADVPVSTTGHIEAAVNFPYTQVNSHWLMPLPCSLKVPRGAVIATTTTNLDSGDEFGKAILFGDILD